jgi:hypothetical protein
VRFNSCHNANSSVLNIQYLRKHQDSAKMHHQHCNRVDGLKTIWKGTRDPMRFPHWGLFITLQPLQICTCLQTTIYKRKMYRKTQNAMPHSIACGVFPASPGHNAIKSDPMNCVMQSCRSILYYSKQPKEKAGVSKGEVKRLEIFNNVCGPVRHGKCWRLTSNGFV